MCNSLLILVIFDKDENNYLSHIYSVMIFLYCLVIIIVVILCIIAELLLQLKVILDFESLIFVTDRFLFFVAAHFSLLCLNEDLQIEGENQWKCKVLSVSALIYSIIQIIVGKLKKLSALIEKIENNRLLIPFNQRLLIFLKNLNEN